MAGGGEHAFHAADYGVFGATLAVSLGIGVFQALSGGRQKTISEYLVGGRQMTVLPVAISLMVSFESSIMMLGMPGEAYVYGIQYLIGSLGYGLAQLLAVHFMVPIIHPLKLTSAYEYLEMRFKSKMVRKVGSILGIINYVWYMGIVLFGPATALKAVTGFNQWYSIFLVAIAAIIYTSIGGLKAVIWTDVFQAGIMFAGMFAVLIKGTIEVGGPSEVWRRANEGGRNNLFNFNPDITVRHTFWTLFIGKSLRGISLIFNQSSIQRITSTKRMRDAMTVMYLVVPGFLLTFILAIMEGVVAYSYYDYHQCDPFESKRISNPNQVVPYMVMDIFKGLPGMPGLFLAALFSASLSTISSGLSSISALTWKDFVQPLYPNMSEFKATLVAKSSVVIFGFLSCAVSLLVSMIGGPLTQIGNSLLSSFGGPLAGLFTLGAVFKSANKKGALVGALVSFTLTMWISMGANFSPSRRKTPWLPPASTEQCYDTNTSVSHVTDLPMQYTTTQEIMTTTARPEPQGIDRLYMLSYVWFSSVGMLTVVLVGLVVSYFTASPEDECDPKYTIPLKQTCYRCIPRCLADMIGLKPEEQPVKEDNVSLDVYDADILIVASEKKTPLLDNGHVGHTTSHLQINGVNQKVSGNGITLSNGVAQLNDDSSPDVNTVYVTASDEVTSEQEQMGEIDTSSGRDALISTDVEEQRAEGSDDAEDDCENHIKEESIIRAVSEENVMKGC